MDLSRAPRLTIRIRNVHLEYLTLRQVPNIDPSPHHVVARLVRERALRCWLSPRDSTTRHESPASGATLATGRIEANFLADLALTVTGRRVRHCGRLTDRHIRDGQLPCR